MDRSLTRLTTGIALSVFSVLAVPAWPGGDGQALAAGLGAKETARAKQARQLYKEGKYADAAKIFSDLSAERPDVLVFTRNLGACYYYLRRPEPALSNLREYLQRAADIAPDDRAEVERWIAEMERLRDQPSGMPGATTAAPAAAAPVPPPVFPATGPTGPAPATQPPATTPEAPLPASAGSPNTALVPPTEAGQTTAAATPASSGAGLRIAGIACGAVGLAAIGTGIYFYTRASSLSDDLTSSSSPSASDFKSGKNAETLQWVFYSVGAGALATGSVLYYLGWQRGSSATMTATVAPAVGPGFAGISAQGAF
jgi:hypothetical protein